MIVTAEDVDSVDYRKYLGPTYQATTPYPSKVSTIVCNHSSWLDVIIMFVSRFKASGVGKQAFKTAPVLGVLCDGL